MRERLASCLIWDASRLARRLRDAEHLLRHGRHPAGARARIEALERDIDRAAAFAAARAAAVPRVEYPPELPIAQRKDEIAALIRAHQVVVVCGETGSGKSTQLPKICLEVGRGRRGFIGHTQPRRIAARSVAQRVAEELNSPLGRTVGFKVRFTDRTSAESLIKVMTDGVLLAETQADRLLERYDTLIIDEAHERSLNIDFLLGYIKTILPRRPDLKIVITSATIDPQRFAQHFAREEAAPVPIVEVSGRTYPVEVRYRPLRSDDPDEEDRTVEQAILDAVDELAAHDAQASDPANPGDILVFLPGEREIRETAEELKHHHLTSNHGRTRTEVMPLYARLSAEEQQRVFQRRPGARRIVLATNVAETSITVPGVRSVIDTGLARISRYSSRSRVQGLPIEKVSQASAKQRAGRCGRVAPGVCIRLYAEDDFNDREEFTPPEILRTNLASVILQMKALGLGEVERFPFVEAPNPRAVQEGYDTLTELNAIDDRGRLTPTGAAMSRLPIDPRLSRMILAARNEKCVPEVLVIAAALSAQDPRERPQDKREAADKAHARWVNAHLRKAREMEQPTGGDAPPIPGVARQRPEDRDESGSDFMALVNLWNEYQRQRAELSSNRLRKWCKDNFLGYMRMREWAEVHAQLARLVTELGVWEKRDDDRVARRSPAGGSAPPSPTTTAEPSTVADEGHVHRALLTGLLVNIGRFDDSTREYAGAHGARFHLFPGSAMFSAKAKWIVAAERVRTTRVYARTVARIRPEWIEELAPKLITRSYGETIWNERTGTAHVFETVFLFGLEVIPRRRANLAHIDPAAARAVFIQNALIEGKYHHHSGFFAHNQRTLAEAARFEAKARRRDLVADLARRFEFYDKRLPDKITSGGAFERWRTQAERERPRLLEMRLEDALRAPSADAPTLPNPADTPDHLLIADATYPLSYRFEPGDHDDGVTITLPLAALAGATPEAGKEHFAALEWLVPAWAPDKISELLRTLQKDARRALGPAPQAAADFLGSKPDRARSLLDQLAAFCSARAGSVITPRDFRPNDLPAHFTMRVLVTDARGRPIAAGRDVSALRAQLRSQVAGALASLRGTEFNRTGITDWEFGDIPESAEVSAAGARVRAYPALFDEGKTVGMRLCDSPDAAAAWHRAGLRRLFALRVRGEVRAALEHAPGHQKLVARWGPMGPAAELNDQLNLLVCERAFLAEPGAASIRTFQAFTERYEAGFGALVSESLALVAVATDIVEALHRARLRLETMQASRAALEWAPALEGVANQIDLLCPRGFLLSTGETGGRLADLPRYLRGAESRLLKVQQGKIAQDQARAAELRPHLRRWLDARDAAGASSPSKRAALHAYRWMLEEYRIMLFAQELKPPAAPGGAITARRLEEQWAAFAAKA